MKRLIMFEKEKGGVGSTGTLVTLAYLLAQRETPLVFVEASLSQLDIANAYHDRAVHELDLGAEDAQVQLIDIVDQAPDGAAILVNVPGSRFEELHRIHKFVEFVLSDEVAFDVEVLIVWTMGLDAASRVTLDAMLDGGPPGRVMLNLPAWQAPPERFSNVDEPLFARIAETGGSIFATPELPTFLYDYFRVNQIAIDRIAGTPGVTFAQKIALREWAMHVRHALGEVF
jgi:hypothetical protein